MLPQMEPLPASMGDVTIKIHVIPAMTSACPFPASRAATLPPTASGTPPTAIGHRPPKVFRPQNRIDVRIIRRSIIVRPIIDVRLILSAPIIRRSIIVRSVIVRPSRLRPIILRLILRLVTRLFALGLLGELKFILVRLFLGLHP